MNRDKKVHQCFKCSKNRDENGTEVDYGIDHQRIYSLSKTGNYLLSHYFISYIKMTNTYKNQQDPSQQNEKEIWRTHHQLDSQYLQSP